MKNVVKQLRCLAVIQTGLLAIYVWPHLLSSTALGNRRYFLRSDFYKSVQLLHNNMSDDVWCLPGTVQYQNDILLDLHPFSFLRNADICHGDNIFLLVMVNSKSDHLTTRARIRATWGNATNLSYRQLNMRVVFLLGVHVGKVNMQSAILKESEQHGDVVQGNFIDSYHNLTYKTLMGFKWAHMRCRQAKFILKTDDDIFIDVFQLTELLLTKLSVKPELMCFESFNIPVDRNEKSKWYVKPSESNATIYTPYCPGYGFILDPRTACVIETTSQKSRFFWVDDFFVTGPLADKSGIRRSHRPEFAFSIRFKDISAWTLDSSNTKPLPHIFNGIGRDSFIMKLWNKTQHIHQKSFKSGKYNQVPLPNNW